jgi:hypothetical protein
VSEDTAKRFHTVETKGTPALQDAVLHGTVSIKDAATVAREQPAVQDGAVEDVKAGRETTAAAAARKRTTSGKPVFDDRKIESAISKLVRLVADRKNALKKGETPAYKDLHKRLNEALQAWKRWQLEGKKK